MIAHFPATTYHEKGHTLAGGIVQDETRSRIRFERTPNHAKHPATHRPVRRRFLIPIRHPRTTSRFRSWKAMALSRSGRDRAIGRPVGKAISTPCIGVHHRAGVDGNRMHDIVDVHLIKRTSLGAGAADCENILFVALGSGVRATELAKAEGRVREIGSRAPSWFRQRQDRPEPGAGRKYRAFLASARYVLLQAGPSGRPSAYQTTSISVHTTSNVTV